MMSVDPQTGLVKAYVGGPNFTLNSLDHVQTKLLVGSTIKPFFYASSMNFGIVDPWTEFTNMEYCVPIPDQPTWCPQTGAPDQDEYPTLTVKKALAKSSNNITVAIMNRFGTPRGPEVFKKLLLDVGFDSAQVEATPAMILGPMAASVYQMTGAHAALANLGVYIKPRYLLRVEDRNGNLIYDTDVEVRRVMSKEEAYRIIEVMKGVINGGTAGRIRSTNYNYGGIPYNIPMAGKTGTTNDASDGWFIGSTPRLVTGVWVGADDMQVHFPDLTWGQGGRMAMPIYGYYMNHLYKDSKLNLFKGDWEKPIGVVGNPLEPSEQLEEEDSTPTWETEL